MKKLNILFPITLILLFFCGCGTTVNLVLSTQDEFNHKTSVEVLEGDEVKSIAKEVILSKNKENTVAVKLKSGQSLQVKSSPEASKGIIYSSEKIPLESIENPSKHEIKIASTAEILNDTKSAEKLVSLIAASELDPKDQPVDLEEACINMIGSLIAVVTDPDTKEEKIEFILLAKHLGVSEMNTEDAKYTSTNQQKSLNLSGAKAKSLAEEVPILSKFDFPFEDNKIYQLDITLNGYGKQIKPENKFKPPTQKLMNLGFKDVNKIKYLIEEKSAKVYYVNQIFLLNEAEIKVKEARLPEDNETAELISENIAYTFGNAETSIKSYIKQAVYFWGNEYSFKFATGDTYSNTGLTINFQIDYSIYNLNKSKKIATQLFD